MDDFFLRGAQSLKAIMMLTKVNKQYKVKVRVKDFYQDTTVKGLAKVINRLMVEELATTS